MRYPKYLKSDGTIGFVAPAFGAATEPYFSAFENAKKRFLDMGYGVNLGPNCYRGDGIGISATPSECGRELTDYYIDEKNAVLMSLGGGELMCETIDYVDFDKVKSAEPKWYMGFSDNTNFTFLLTTICDVASIYGPCAPAFGMESWHPALDDAWGLLTGEKNRISGYELWEKESLKNADNPMVPYNVTEKKSLKLYGCDDEKVTFSGRLIGGCLDCLANLVGTRYDKVSEFNERYGGDGIVWFLESCDLNVFSIRRALWQLDRSGWFEKAVAFVIGRPLCFGQEMFGLDQYKAVTDILGKYNVPIVMDADIGHLPPMMPMVLGSLADITVDDNVHIEYRFE